MFIFIVYKKFRLIVSKSVTIAVYSIFSVFQKHIGSSRHGILLYTLPLSYDERNAVYKEGRPRIATRTITKTWLVSPAVHSLFLERFNFRKM